MPLGTPLYGSADAMEHQVSTRSGVPSGGTNPTAPTPYGVPYNSPQYPTAPTNNLPSGMPWYQQVTTIPRTGTTTTSTSSLDPYTQLLMQQLRSTIGGYGTDALSYANQVNQANALRDFNANALNTQYGFDAATLAENRFRDVDLKRQQEAQALANALAGYGIEYRNYARLDDLAGQAFGNQQADLGQLLARLNRERGTAWTGANENLNLAGTRKDIGLENNLAGYNADQRQAQSQATARGAMLSSGYRDLKNELRTALNLADRGVQAQYTGAVNQYDQAIRNIQDQFAAGMDTYNTGQRDAMLNYNTRLGDTAYQRDKTLLDEKQTKEQNQQVNAMLDSIAREYGIKSENLKFTLQNGIDRLGIDLESTLTALASDFNSTNAQRRAQAQTLAAQILQMGQLTNQQQPQMPSLTTTSQQTQTQSPTLTQIRNALGIGDINFTGKWYDPRTWLNYDVDNGVRTTASRTMTEQELRDLDRRISNFEQGTFSTDPAWQAEYQRRFG